MKQLRKILAGLAIGAIAIGSGGALATSLSYFTGPSGTNPIQFPSILTDFNVFVTAVNNALAPLGLSNINTVQTTFGPIGRVYTQTGPTTALATNTGGVTLATYTIPAGSLDVAGRTVRIRMSFHKAANFDQANVGCGIAGDIVTMNIPTTDNGGQEGECDFAMTQGVTANTQMFSGNLFYSGKTTVNQASLVGTTTTSFTTTNAVSAYGAVGTPTGAGDIVIDNFEVTYEN